MAYDTAVPYCSTILSLLLHFLSSCLLKCLGKQQMKVPVPECCCHVAMPPFREWVSKWKHAFCLSVIFFSFKYMNTFPKERKTQFLSCMGAMWSRNSLISGAAHTPSLFPAQSVGVVSRWRRALALWDLWLLQGASCPTCRGLLHGPRLFCAVSGGDTTENRGFTKS